MKKKSLALIFSLALIVIGIAGGTLAWLTAKTNTVVNTFTTSDIEITLAESTGDTYKMVPGFTIAKDPKVTVLEGSEKCYLFVKLEKSANFDAFLSYEIADGWTALDGTANVYYRVVEPADMGTNYSVLKNDRVTVLETVTKTDLNGLTTDTYPDLKITAYASQYHKNAAGIFTASEAWTSISGN